MPTDGTISKTPPSTAELLRRHDDVEQARNKQHVSLRQFLLQDVDPKEATGPLALYCFMTGYMCGISLHFFLITGPLVVVTLSRSLPSSYGVDFKPATLLRYALPLFYFISEITVSVDS